MNANELREATATHVESMDAAVRAAGIVPDEPLAPVLAEWRRSLAWAGELTARMAEIGEAVEVRLAAAPAGGPAAIEPTTLARLEEAAASGASLQAVKLARAHNWRTLAIVGGSLVVGVSVTALGGYLVGRNSTMATASAIEAAAMRDGPKAADMWLTWMRNNDGRLVASACEAEAVKSTGGRRGCGVGLWLEPPGNAMPRTNSAK